MREIALMLKNIWQNKSDWLFEPAEPPDLDSIPHLNKGDEGIYAIWQPRRNPKQEDHVSLGKQNAGPWQMCESETHQEKWLKDTKTIRTAGGATQVDSPSRTWEEKVPAHSGVGRKLSKGSWTPSGPHEV